MEIWKDIQGHEGKYQISSKGRVKSLARINNQGRQMEERILSPSKDKDGYRRISLSNGSRGNSSYFRINRLVAIHFIPNPNDLPQVNHIDGIRDNDEVENLEWCDNSHNQWHRCHINDNPPDNDYKKKQVKATLPNNDEMIFESIKEAGNYFKTSASAVKNKLYAKVENPSFRRKSDPLYGIKFEYYDQTL